MSFISELDGNELLPIYCGYCLQKRSKGDDKYVMTRCRSFLCGQCQFRKCAACNNQCGKLPLDENIPAENRQLFKRVPIEKLGEVGNAFNYQMKTAKTVMECNHKKVRDF